MTSKIQKLYPLQIRKIFKKNIGSVVAIVVFWVIGAYILLFANLPEGIEPLRYKIWSIWVMALIVLVVWKNGYEFLYYLCYFYEIDDKNVIIKKGVLAKSEVTLPFSKITDVYVDQDMLDVLFGLYDLHISTPTAESGHLAHIDGLNRAGAEEIRKIVLAKINSAI